MANQPFKKLRTAVDVQKQRFGVETYSRYVSGQELTYFTKGLAARGWPELATDNLNHLLADLVLMAIADEWNKVGKPILGKHIYHDGKRAIPYLTETFTYDGNECIRATWAGAKQQIG